MTHPQDSNDERENMEFQNLLDVERLEDQFDDFKPALNDTEAFTEANRCLNCFSAPCIRACPTEINIPQFISRIGTGNVLGAARTILNSNILGHSCAVSCPTEVLCEGACVYHDLNKRPIMIGKLQRYAVESAYQQGVHFYTPGLPTGKRVALVGAGPASLACAHELRIQGHETIIFEKSLFPGGLNTQGIAPYKMRARTSLREIEQISHMGVRFEFDRELGRNLQLTQLMEQYDAVFLGLGLGPDSRLNIPGADHPRVQGAVEFIAQLKTAAAPHLRWIREVKTAVVIGGGNTALDACRELKKLGLPRVLVSYRRGESDMSGYRHEFEYARKEGVEFVFYTLPVQIASENTSQMRVKLQKTFLTKQGEIQMGDESFQVETNLILVATGQSKLEKLISEIPGLKFENGRLQVHAQTGETGNSKIFSGGDLTNGGKEVVNAVAEGKRAALGIHERLSREMSHG